MYNNGGNPAFTADTIYTADPGCYEIDTGTDFTPNLNFLIGLGGTDNFGRMKPLATVLIHSIGLTVFGITDGIFLDCGSR